MKNLLPCLTLAVFLWFFPVKAIGTILQMNLTRPLLIINWLPLFQQK